jgi:hypothetical protein
VRDGRGKLQRVGALEDERAPAGGAGRLRAGEEDARAEDRN